MRESLTVKEITLRLAHAEDMSGDFDGAILAELVEQIREEGREELLKEIAALGPYSDHEGDLRCRLCDRFTDQSHDPKCPFARIAATQEPVK